MKLILLPIGLALAAAGCGGAKAVATPSKGARVDTHHTMLGTVLTDTRGRTLYLFEKDKGSTSSCYGSCASVWPPLTTGAKAVAGVGALASQIGSSKRSDGKQI